MPEQSKAKQGDFTLKMPKQGDEANGYWEINLRKMTEGDYVAASNYFRKEKDMEGIRFILNTLYVGGDDIKQVTADWEALVASAKQILSVMPGGQGMLKKN